VDAQTATSMPEPGQVEAALINGLRATFGTGARAFRPGSRR
jgi:hypothetical protein